jgi:hypothetical protein
MQQQQTGMQTEGVVRAAIHPARQAREPAAFGQINRHVFRRRLSTQYRERFQVKALWPISANVRAIRTCFQALSLSFALTVFCLPQRPLVRRGTRRDRLTSYLRLKYGRFEPSNPSVDVFQGIGIHR